jgi:hypothetical protein
VFGVFQGWLQGLVAQFLPAATTAAGLLLFQTPAFGEITEVRGIWEAVRGIADALFVLALLLGGGLVMVSGAFETRYTAKRLFPRLLLGIFMANVSLVLCSNLIRLDNALVVTVLGSDPAANSWGAVTGQLATTNLAGGIVFALVVLAGAVMALFLAVVYIVRDLLLFLLTVSAPLVLGTYGVPGLDEAAGLWWRGYLLALFLQVGHALLLKLGVLLLAHPAWLGTPASALISALMLVALFYVMFKLPFAAYEWAFRHPVSQSPVVSRVRSTVSNVVLLAKAAAVAA